LSRIRDRKPQPQRTTSPLDEARNELFSHINRCGVLRADEQQQVEWMQDTIEFMGERYPSLSKKQLEELQAIGLRFCRPVMAKPAADEAEAAESAAA
jgi:hypothetical protein